jgi:hypothetical protein
MPADVPKWPQKPADEPAFKAFIFAELDRRIWGEIAAMAAEAQRPENIERFLAMVEAGWAPPAPPKRGRGRPPVDRAVRQALPSEAAVRIAVMIRQIFEDNWGRRNLTRPSPAEMAAEYVGLKREQIETRLRRGKARRPL